MPYRVIYEAELPYRSLPGFSVVSLALPVTLEWNGRTAQTVGVLDSGSTHTVFSSEIASPLGIRDITQGTPLDIRTAGGVIRMYLHDLGLEVRTGLVHRRFFGQVGFAESHLPRNILGLNLVFQQFQIGFRDSRQRVYLLPEA